MEERLIAIKLRDGTLLEVSRNILIQDSPKFKQLLVDLKFEEHEIDDFSPQVARLFVSLLERKQLEESDIDNSNFRELHKIAAAFEVVWLKDACYEWLKKLMKSCQTLSEKSFLFEECSYIFRKWKDETLMNELITCLIQQDNSALIEKYLVDISKLEIFQIDTLLKIGGCNVTIFLKNIMKNLEGKTQLEKKMKYLLKTMNLAVCSELNHDLYLDVIDRISNLEEISAADLRYTLNMTTKVWREVKKRERRNTETILIDLKELETISHSHHLYLDREDYISGLILSNKINSMFIVVDMVLHTHAFWDSRDRVTEEVNKEIKWLEEIEKICKEKKIQKVSRCHLDTIISTLENYWSSYHLLQVIRNSNILSTNYETILIGSVGSEKSLFGALKHKFYFKHPTVDECSQAGRCGFMIEESKNDKVLLCTDEKEYRDSGIHFHDVISAADMHWFGSRVGNNRFTNRKVIVVGTVKWEELTFPLINDWKNLQNFVAYDISKYVLYKSD